MARRRTVVVQAFGECFRLTRRRWFEYLRALQQGQDAYLEDYGRSICVVDYNVTDMTPDEIAGYLEEER